MRVFFFFSSRRRHTRYWRDWSSDVCSSDLIAENLEPSPRGELEITDVNLEYLLRGELQVEVMGRGMAWLDAGTHESLLQSATFIETLELRQGLKIGSPEEVAYRMGYIDAEQLERLAVPMKKSGYGQYLLELLSDEEGVGERRKDLGAIAQTDRKAL